MAQIGRIERLPTARPNKGRLLCPGKWVLRGPGLAHRETHVHVAQIHLDECVLSELVIQIIQTRRCLLPCHPSGSGRTPQIPDPLLRWFSATPLRAWRILRMHHCGPLWIPQPVPGAKPPISMIVAFHVSVSMAKTFQSRTPRRPIAPITCVVRSHRLPIGPAAETPFHLLPLPRNRSLTILWCFFSRPHPRLYDSQNTIRF